MSGGDGALLCLAKLIQQLGRSRAARFLCHRPHKFLSHTVTLYASSRARGTACRAAIIDRQRGNEQPSFRAYIDFQALKSNLSCHIQNVRNRNSDASPEKVVHLYEQWTHLLGEVEQLRAERNANAKSMKVRNASLQQVSPSEGSAPPKASSDNLRAA